MANDPAADASVVILVLDALTSAVVDGFAGDDDFVVVIFVVVSADQAAAGCLLAGEAAVVVHAAPPLCYEMTWGTPPTPTNEYRLRSLRRAWPGGARFLRPSPGLALELRRSFSAAGPAASGRSQIGR